MNNLCCVFVCNKEYLPKFIKTCKQLINIGQYRGDICLIIGDDLKHEKIDFARRNKIIVKYFPNIIFPNEFHQINKNINSDGRNLTKTFQWHKLHLFNPFFKKWKYIFYLDCAMIIHQNIYPLLNSKQPNTLLAHSDAYPSYEWKLKSQFDNNQPLFNSLNSKFNLNIDYFQTGLLLFDTNIIDKYTFNNLLYLATKFPISRTNEQGIVALYFIHIKPYWKQIPLNVGDIYLYNYRALMSKNYIITKLKIT